MKISKTLPRVRRTWLRRCHVGSGSDQYVPSRDGRTGGRTGGHWQTEGGSCLDLVRSGPWIRPGSSKVNRERKLVTHSALFWLGSVRTRLYPFRALSVLGFVPFGLCLYSALSLLGSVRTRLCPCWALSVLGFVPFGLCPYLGCPPRC